MTHQAGVDRSSAGRIMLALVASITLLFTLAFSMARTTLATTDHCPDHDVAANTKVESAEDEGALVFAAGTEFCAKKGTGTTGVLVADGTTTLYGYLEAAGIDGAQGEGPSYYVLYGTDGGGEEEPDLGGILIEKVDENDEPLSGGVFTVEGVDGEFTTGEDGRVCVPDLPEDTTLTVTEIQAPAGYEIADPASQEVEVDDDGCDRSVEVTFVNVASEGEEDLGGILIEKVDENDEPLAGGVFTVEGVEGEFTTGEDGLVCVPDLPEETTLTVTEIQAPAGYEIANPASQEVEVDDDGCDNSVEVTFVNEAIEGEEDLGSITIIKVAVPNADVDFAFTGDLGDFSLDLDDDGTLPDQWTFTDLAAGSYTVTETAATGWTLTDVDCTAGGMGDMASGTATITLGEGADVTCTFTNTRQGGGTQPGGSGPTPTPAGGQLGGNPTPTPGVPDTALMQAGEVSTSQAILALVALLSLGGLAYAWLAEARVRR